jgi:hypothetical protein
MLDPDLIDAEKEAQNQPLISDLARYFDTQAEDRASLTSIRARLLQKTATTLPVAEPVEEAEEIKLPTPLPLYRAKNARVQPVRRHPYLNVLVAACLLVVPVGSFAFVINRRTTSTGKYPPAPAPAIAHDWSILKTFSGTGSKTIDGLDIDVGHKYGLLANCTNTSSGMVTLKLNGWQSGGGSCSTKATEPLTPEYTFVSPSVGSLIFSIQVTANASTSWKFWLFKGVYYPPLTMFGANSGFHPLSSEFDGTGNSTILLDVTIPTVTWALGFECHGTGFFNIALSSGLDSASPAMVANNHVSCNGVPNGDQYDNGYLQGTVIRQIRITTGPENDWQVILGGCTNNLPSCGIKTVDPTVTP